LDEAIRLYAAFRGTTDTSVVSDTPRVAQFLFRSAAENPLVSGVAKIGARRLFKATVVLRPEDLALLGIMPVDIARAVLISENRAAVAAAAALHAVVSSPDSWKASVE
jgi:hypothetical protein